MRLVAALGVAGLALAPLGLGAVPAWPGTVAVSAGLALAGAVGVWRAPNGALVVASAGLTLALADLATRPLLDRVTVRPEDRYVRLWRVDPPASRMEPRVDVVWPTVGNLAALGGPVRQPRAVRFVTDAWGRRSDPLGGPAQVVLLGDSFGAGVGTSQEQTVASRLTARHGLATVNLSLAGASPYDAWLRLDAALPSLDLAPDATLVWLLFAGNDLAGACRERLPPPPSRVNRLRAWIATQRVRSVLGRTLRRLRASPEPPIQGQLPDGRPMLFFQPDLESAALTPAQALARPQAGCVRRVMGQVRALAARAGLRLLVAVTPTSAEVYGPSAGLPSLPGGTTAALRALATEQGLALVDLGPALSAAAQAGETVWWRDDTHWNGRGHAVAARVLAAAVREGPSPPGSRTR